MVRWVERTLLAAAVAAAALSLASSAAADQIYTDGAGDGQGGPDITSVSVSQASGLVQFLVTTKDPLTASQAIAILVDADGNESTGFQGAEYALYAGAPVPSACGCGLTATFNRFTAWNGSALVEAHPESFRPGMIAGNVAQLLVDTADIGNASSFRFAAIGVNVASPDTGLDRAPDSGWYTYAPPVAVTLAAPRAKASLHAGGSFTIAARVGTPATGATVLCTATIAGTAVRESGRVAANTAACSGKLPKASFGKRLIGTMTVTVGGSSATRRFSFRILNACGCG